MPNTNSKLLSYRNSWCVSWQQRVVGLGSFSVVMSWAMASGRRQTIVADETIAGTATG